MQSAKVSNKAIRGIEFQNREAERRKSDLY